MSRRKSIGPVVADLPVAALGTVAQRCLGMRELPRVSAIDSIEVRTRRFSPGKWQRAEKEKGK
jgi:hypothetical protein